MKSATAAKSVTAGAAPIVSSVASEYSTMISITVNAEATPRGITPSRWMLTDTTRRFFSLASAVAPSVAMRYDATKVRKISITLMRSASVGLGVIDKYCVPGIDRAFTPESQSLALTWSIGEPYADDDTRLRVKVTQMLKRYRYP